MPTIRTLAGPTEVELPKIKGSRFLAVAAPAPSEAAAMAVLERVRAEHPDANHHCWAYRLDADTARSSDDGEPAGTGGPPILRRIGGADLDAAVVVVVRYFGGTKLGTGGLVRAYGEAAAAAAALEAAEVVSTRVRSTLTVTYPYDATGSVDGVLAAHDVVEVDAAYGQDVQRTLSVVVEEHEALVTALTDATRGRLVLREDGIVGASPPQDGGGADV